VGNLVYWHMRVSGIDHRERYQSIDHKTRKCIFHADACKR